MTNWTQAEAITMCRLIESLCPEFGCHVALTGGLLYKHGMRKDCDIVFYQIRQTPAIDVDGLFEALRVVGVERQTEGAHWCIKATYQGMGVDCFFPEHQTGSQEYDRAVEVDEMLEEECAF